MFITKLMSLSTDPVYFCIHVFQVVCHSELVYTGKHWSYWLVIAADYLMKRQQLQKYSSMLDTQQGSLENGI